MGHNQSVLRISHHTYVDTRPCRSRPETAKFKRSRGSPRGTIRLRGSGNEMSVSAFFKPAPVIGPTPIDVLRTEELYRAPIAQNNLISQPLNRSWRFPSSRRYLWDQTQSGPKEVVHPKVGSMGFKRCYFYSCHSCMIHFLNHQLPLTSRALITRCTRMASPTTGDPPPRCGARPMHHRRSSGSVVPTSPPPLHGPAGPGDSCD